jgi:hypothetical protein
MCTYYVVVPTENSSADVVCTEKVIRFDSVTNPASVGGDDCPDPPAICSCAYRKFDPLNDSDWCLSQVSSSPVRAHSPIQGSPLSAPH